MADRSFTRRVKNVLGYRVHADVERDEALAALRRAPLRGAARWRGRSGPLGGGPAAADADLEWEFHVDGHRQAGASTGARLVADIVLALNALAIPEWHGVVCHAGGVARDGSGVMLPAEPESGKTTLTAGLVRHGFDYLTDEGVAFRPGTNIVEPYPKPLSIDVGSWPLFPEFEPSGRARYRRVQGDAVAGAAGRGPSWCYRLPVSGAAGRLPEVLGGRGYGACSR